MCLGPVICYLCISALLHMNLTSAYGTQLWLYGGLLALVSFQLDERAKNWRWSAAWCVGTALCMFVTAGSFNVAHSYVVQ